MDGVEFIDIVEVQAMRQKVGTVGMARRAWLKKSSGGVSEERQLTMAEFTLGYSRPCCGLFWLLREQSRQSCHSTTFHSLLLFE